MTMTAHGRASLTVAIGGAVATFFGAVVTASAPAAVTFSYVTDQATYQVAPSAPAVVSVYLRETTTDGSGSLLVAENGIYSFDVAATRTSGSATITGIAANTSQFATSLGAMYSPSLPLPAAGVAAADFFASSLDTVGLTGTPSGNTRTILLGTYTVTAAAFEGASSTFAVSDSTFFGTGTATVARALEDGYTGLDASIASTSFTVTAVPEPSGLAALAPAAFLARRRRARRAATGR